MSPHESTTPAGNASGPVSFTSALQRYQPYLDEAQYAKLIAESERIAPSAVRLNLLKLTSPLPLPTGEGEKTTSPRPQPPEEGETESAKNTTQLRLDYLSRKYGWVTKALPYSAESLQILDYDTYPSQTREFLLGQYYLQDAASILPISLFSTSDRPLLKLDMAASPGGKTTQMIDTSRDRDFVIANDAAASRLPALRTVLQTWGAANYTITNFAGERWGDWFPETFDQILLDAPCSMQSLRASASHPHRPITEDERSRLASRQQALLFSAAKALKIGGELVYSTCTLAPEEDESVVSALLETYPGAFRIDPAPAQQFCVSGLSEFEGERFHPEVIHSLRIWPFVFQTNGFFAVKLIKVTSIRGEQSPPPSRDFASTGYRALSPRLLQELNGTFQQIYGFDLDGMLQKLNLVPMRKVDAIQLLPASYLTQFATLPYNAIGVPLGRFIRDQFEVSVDFVLRFGTEFSRNVWQMPDNLVEQWMKGFDIRGIDPVGIEPGTVIAIRDVEGNNLGAAKYSSKRLRNLLPNRHIKI
jgi:16S rRNA (cytosine1407-C5)-methyltransferase